MFKLYKTSLKIYLLVLLGAWSGVCAEDDTPALDLDPFDAPAEDVTPLEEILTDTVEEEAEEIAEEKEDNTQQEIDDAISNVLDNSPFLPPGYVKPKPPIDTGDFKPPPPPPTRLDLEFRGLVQMGKNSMYSLYDPKKKTSFWATQNMPVEGITVKSYNPLSNSITVETKKGQKQELFLAETKIGTKGAKIGGGSLAGTSRGSNSSFPAPVQRKTSNKPNKRPSTPDNKQPLEEMSDGELEAELLEFLEELSKQLEGLDE